MIETLIATALLVTAFAGLLHLLALSVRFTRESGQFGVALVAAQDKLESLRALPFGYDAAGAPVTDPRLAESPASSLSEDTAPYVDWLDAAGAPLLAPAGAELVRRWRIAGVDGEAHETIAIDVCVFVAPASGREPAAADACLAAIRVRQP